MKAPLSQNEFETLDRQMATLNYQLTDIANLVESRLGQTTELAVSARAVQRELSMLARRIHRQYALGSGEPLAGKGQTA